MDSISFVLSFRLVVLRLFLVSPSLLYIFASLLTLVADSVILLVRIGATPPRALLASLKYAYSPYMLVACVDVDLFLFFLLFLRFFDFDLDIACFILSFSCGYYAVSSVSVSAATRLAYDIMYLDTYADLTFLFLS